MYVVLMLGYVDDKQKHVFYNTYHVFPARYLLIWEKEGVRVKSEPGAFEADPKR